MSASVFLDLMVSEPEDKWLIDFDWSIDRLFLCLVICTQVTEMLLCADTLPEAALRRAVEVVASQCYTKVRCMYHMRLY